MDNKTTAKSLDEGITFFNEGHDVRLFQPNLMSFAYDDGDDALGMVGYVVRAAREILTGASSGQIWAMLSGGDDLLWAALKTKRLRNRESGEVVNPGDLYFARLNQMDFLPVVLSLFNDYEFVLQDDAASVPDLRITPEGFCAAYILRMVYNATRGVAGVNHRAYYLMQAAAAFGVMQSLRHAVEDDIAAIVERSVKSKVARIATSGRWARLDGAKALAFKRRKELSTLSRSAAIDRMLPDVLNACRKAGEPLTGGDPKATVTRWFREAGIK